MKKIVSRLLTSSVIISLLGFIDALYLLYADLSGTIYCPLSGGLFQCEEVHKHYISSVLHISLWGTIFYLALIIVLLLSLRNENPYLLGFFLPVFGVVGFVFSIFLTSIEIFVIKFFCEFCLLSAICSTIIFVLIFAAKRLEQGSFVTNLSFWKIFNKEA